MRHILGDNIMKETETFNVIDSRGKRISLTTDLLNEMRVDGIYFPAAYDADGEFYSPIGGGLNGIFKRVQ